MSKMDDMIEKALAEITPQGLEDETRDLKRLARGTRAAETMAARLDHLMDAFNSQAAVIETLRAELRDYRHRYHVAVGTLIITTVGVVLAWVGRPLWALVNSIVENGV